MVLNSIIFEPNSFLTIIFSCPILPNLNNDKLALSRYLYLNISLITIYNVVLY